MHAHEPSAHVDLFWLPLGAGGHCVRLNGRVYERTAALVQGREPRDLYHTALEVQVPEGRFVVEQAPARDDGRARGVVAEGPVGSRLAGTWRLFRYEVRRWPGGAIPDVAEAVESPQRLTTDPALARRLLELAPCVPVLTWGRDESGAGEMWNSNSIVAWLLVRSGVDVEAIAPPRGGRAPGWAAGARVAHATPAEMPQAPADRVRMEAPRPARTVRAQLEARRTQRR